MKNNISALSIIFENGDNVVLNSNEFKDFYIANIDENGNEIPYEQTIIKNKMYANFLLLSINFNNIDHNTLKRIKNKNDITEIMIVFKDNRCLNFVLASNANPFSNNYQNDYEYIYEDDNTFGLLLSKYNIKYRNNLFI